MPKERSINPAQAQRKAEKQKEIKKNKQNLQSQRNEKLARRNPDRVQKQIDELKELEKRGPLRPKDKDILSQLEKDLRGIRKARELLGDAAPKFPSHERRDHDRGNRTDDREQRQFLGKRRRDNEDAYQSDTDPEVTTIPMPRDTPPPFPRSEQRSLPPPQIGPDGKRIPHALPSKPTPAAPSQATYSSAPQLRNLTKEALQFVPAAVAQNKKRVHGQGKLLEADEADRLEKAGYFVPSKSAAGADPIELPADKSERQEEDIDEELRRFEKEVDQRYPSTRPNNSHQVQLEDAEDDGD